MREPVWDPPPSGVWSFNITVTEADAVLLLVQAARSVRSPTE